MIVFTPKTNSASTSDLFFEGFANHLLAVIGAAERICGSHPVIPAIMGHIQGAVDNPKDAARLIHDLQNLIEKAEPTHGQALQIIAGMPVDQLRGILGTAGKR